MDHILLLSLALKLLLAGLAYGLLLAISVHLDRRASVNFPAMMERLHEHPVALGIYLAGRAIGLALLLGQTLSG